MAMIVNTRPATFWWGHGSISKLIEQLTFNISLKLIAGKRFSAKDYEEQGSEAWRINRAIKEATHLFGVFVLGDAIPWLESIDFQGHVGSILTKRLDYHYSLNIASLMQQ